MSRQDWDGFGEDIFRTVQDAVDSRDFSRLNQSILDTLNRAADTIGRGMKDVGDAVEQGMRGGRGVHPKGFDGESYRRTGAEQSYRYQEADPGTAGDAYRHRETRRAENEYTDYGRPDTRLYAGTTGSKVFGILFTVFGYVIAGIFLVLLLIMLIGAFVTDGFLVGLLFAAGLFLVLFGVGITMAVIGTKRLGLVSRFQRYRMALGSREYCDVKELCEKLGKTPQYVVKDLQKMIRCGWFRQGHLDEQKSCLMTSNAAYDQYKALQQQMEQKKREEAERAAQQEASGLSPEVQEIIRKGDEYVAKIRACNDAIPGEEISAKISRIEMLVDRIFDRVEQDPDAVTDIRRLMEYYLPTTIKLLEAYEELDMQPVQGENILSSKMEIEKTLDTLNVAFEKLLDSMFQDTAWDVSSDISVLNTMLAQEGLKEEDFK